MIVENSFNIFNSLNLEVKLKPIKIFYKVFKVDINLDF